MKARLSKISCWKAHLLRYVNQDEGRLEVTNAVDESSVLLVQDWAMTFLPRKSVDRKQRLTDDGNCTCFPNFQPRQSLES